MSHDTDKFVASDFFIMFQTCFNLGDCFYLVDLFKETKKKNHIYLYLSHKWHHVFKKINWKKILVVLGFTIYWKSLEVNLDNIVSLPLSKFCRIRRINLPIYHIFLKWVTLSTHIFLSDLSDKNWRPLLELLLL